MKLIGSKIAARHPFVYLTLQSFFLTGLQPECLTINQHRTPHKYGKLFAFHFRL